MARGRRSWPLPAPGNDQDGSLNTADRAACPRPPPVSASVVGSMGLPEPEGHGSADLKKALAGLFDAAGLKDARSHDLRRTFGSIAADMGYSEATIGELLGHARRGVTMRHYVRLPDAALIEAANQVSARVAAALDGRELLAEIIPLPSARMR